MYQNLLLALTDSYWRLNKFHNFLKDSPTVFKDYKLMKTIDLHIKILLRKLRLDIDKLRKKLRISAKTVMPLSKKRHNFILI